MAHKQSFLLGALCGKLWHLWENHHGSTVEAVIHHQVTLNAPGRLVDISLKIAISRLARR